ncbi:MAG TPA: hypothetical protein VM144_03450 [Aestuariivirga sp.]|nr:hypothetical protein [Aestuariivirga sp.]
MSKSRAVKFAMACSVAIVAIGSGGIVKPANAATLVDTSYFGGSRYDYYVESTGVLWSTASAAAGLLGGTLAALTSDAENAHVAGHVDANAGMFGGIVGPWLGGYCDENCGTLTNWNWVTAESNARLTSSASWALGQPDGFEINPHYLLYYNGGSPTGTLWGDYGSNCGPLDTCGAGPVTGYVVETLVPLPAALPLFAVGLSAIGFMGWRRKRKVSVN